MVTWYTDKGLATLIGQVKAQHPGMVVGTIAGGGHVSTWPDTDHAPEPDGSVDAADFMVGPKFTKLDGDRLVMALVQHRDRRIAYIIWQGRIMSSTVQPWVWRVYKGSDPHTNHVHLSVNDSHENDKSNWDLSVVEKMPAMFTINDVQVPIIGEGDDDAKLGGYNHIARIQRLKGIEPDGVWGPLTTKAVGAKKMTVALYNQIYGLS